MPIAIYNYKISPDAFNSLYIKKFNSLYPNSGKAVLNV